MEAVELDRRLQSWLLDQLGADFKLDRVERLLGGISSTMCLLHVSERTTGRQLSFVMRAVLPSDGLYEEPGILEREAATLQLLAERSIFTDEAVDRLKHIAQDSSASQAQSPRCIAFDASGEEAGSPALLMTVVPGKVSLPAEPSDAWLQELASAIAPLHQATLGLSDFPWRYKCYASAELLHRHPDRHPALQWSAHRERWEALIQYMLQPAPDYAPCLIHRDYHPTNVLWNEQQQITGIVDWVNGCLGPAGVDVGHCRVNQVELYGLEAANTFLAAYMKANPTFVYHPYWDINCLMDMTAFGEIGVYDGWTALGFQDLTDDIIRQRIEQYAEYLLQLLHTNHYSL